MKRIIKHGNYTEAKLKNKRVYVSGKNDPESFTIVLKILDGDTSKRTKHEVKKGIVTTMFKLSNEAVFALFNCLTIEMKRRHET